MQTDVLHTGLTYGPIGVALLLLFFGHRVIPKMIHRAKTATTDPKIRRLYDWLHVAVWSVVVFMLVVGTGGWIYKLVDDESGYPIAQTELIVRGAFTKVKGTVGVHTQHGHLFSRISHSRSKGWKDIHWIYNNMESGEVPRRIAFLFTEEIEVNGELRESTVYCTVVCDDIGLNSNYHREITFDSSRKILNVPTMENRVITCAETDLPYYPSGPVVSRKSGGSTAIGLIKPANAADAEFDGRAELGVWLAARQALTSRDMRSRHSARIFFRDNHWQKPEFLYELVLNGVGPYLERMGAMWALSRVDPLPRNNMFEKDRHPELVWREMLKAALDVDKTISQVGWRFVMGYPNNHTLRRLKEFQVPNSHAEKHRKYLSLIADFRYYRGVSVLVAQQLGWDGPKPDVAVAEMEEARTLLSKMRREYDYPVSEVETAKTLFGEGWALAEAAERSKNRRLKRAEAKSKLKEFLSLESVNSELYTYGWQRDQSKAYLKTGSVKAFVVE